MKQMFESVGAGVGSVTSSKLITIGIGKWYNDLIGVNIHVHMN